MTNSTRSATYGGNGGASFDDSHDVAAWGRIRELVVRHGNRIDAVGIGYENGNFLNRGGTGGTATRIVLDADEAITGISGRAGEEVDQLKITSTKRTYGPYGGGNGKPFTVDLEGKTLHYLFGRAGTRIDQLGFAYGDLPPALPSTVKRSGMHGGTGGHAFDDLATSGVGKIASITVRHGKYIDQLAAHYSGGPAPAHGGGGGDAHTFTLGDDEWLTEVRGRAGSRLDQLQLVTSKGRFSPVYGGHGGSPFTERLDGHIIKALCGRAGNTVDQLGVYFEDAKPYSVVITAMDFDVDQSRIVQMPPIALMTTLLENRTTAPQQVEQRTSVTVTDSRMTSITETHGAKVELSVTKEFTAVWKAELKIGYSYSRATSTESTHETSTTNEFVFAAMVPPGSTIRATCLARRDSFDIPWTATAQVSYRDRADPVTQTLHGRLTGVQCSALDARYEPVEE